MKFKKYLSNKEIQIFLISIIFLLIFINPNVKYGYERSRIATVDSLVERGTFIIDNSSFSEKCSDKIYVDCGSNPHLKSCGHFYSEKPPFFSVLGAGIYFIIKNLFGLNINDSLIVPYLLIFLLVSLPCALLLVYFYRALGLVNIKSKYRFLLTLGLGFATGLLPRTIVFLNHIPALVLVFISFYFLLKLRLLKKENIQKDLFLVGLLIGFASIIDYTCMVFIVLYSLYIILTSKLRNKYLYFIAGLVIPLGIHFILNYIIFGIFKPAYFIKRAFEYKGSPWPSYNLINAQSNPLKDLFNLFLGNKSLFVFNPILIIPFIYLLFVLFFKEYKLKKEALMVLLGTGAIYIIYITRFRTSFVTSGLGFRFGLVVIPLIMFFGAYFFKENLSKARLCLFYISFIISGLISIMSLLFFRGWINFPIWMINWMIIIIIFFLFALFYYFDI